MNKKLIGAVLGTFALGGMQIARAGEAPAKEDKPAKETKKGKKAGKAKKGEAKEGGEKSCKGADGKGCNGDKAAK
jgi:hypothetical protein